MPIPEPKETRGLSLWPFLVTCAVVAGWIDLGSLHREQSADSIVPVLVSLQHWTPFYWGQDRFGMLLPLLALPFRNPLANLLMQAWLGTFSALAAAFLLTYYVIDDTLWPLIATLANAFVILFVRHGTQFDWFVTHIYAPSLTLALAAFILIERRRSDGTLSQARMITAAILVLSAHWENFGIILAAAPLVILRRIFRPASTLAQKHPDGLVQQPAVNPTPRSRLKLVKAAQSPTLRALSLLVLGALGGWLAMSFASSGVRYWEFLAPSEWPSAWSGVAHQAWNAAFPNPYPPILLAVLALVGVDLLLCVPALRGYSPRFLVPAIALAHAALFYSLFVGSLVWVVKLNASHVRYVLIPLLFVIVILTLLAIAPLAIVFRKTSPNFLYCVAPIVLLAAAGHSYGWPSPRRVRDDLAYRCGRMVEAILDTHAILVAGDYWKVWPAVFFCNLTLHERGDSTQVYGLTFRSSETHHLWAGMPLRDLRAASAPNDQEAQGYLDSVGLPLVLAEHHSTIDLFALPPCDVSPEALTLNFHVPSVAGLADTFPFLISARAGTRCWLDSEQSTVIPGNKEMVVEWSGEKLGNTLRSTFRLAWPSGLAPGEVRPVLASAGEPTEPGTYWFRLVEFDHKALHLPPEKVVLTRPLGSNSTNSPGSLSAEYTPQTVPKVFRAGGKETIQFYGKNTGAAAWLSLSPGTAGSVGLGYRWYNRSGEQVKVGRIYLQHPVYPGAGYTFIGPVYAPGLPGDYTLKLELVSDWIVWFEDVKVQPVSVSVKVVPY